MVKAKSRIPIKHL